MEDINWLKKIAQKETIKESANKDTLIGKLLFLGIPVAFAYYLQTHHPHPEKMNDQEIVDTYHQTTQTRQPEQPPEKNVSQPKPRSQTLDSNALLNIIGQAESNGNYNAYYGHASNQKIQFASMSLNDVIKWQNTFVKNGSPSSAVGKYQFIRKTLQDLMRSAGVNGNEIFTQTMQDRLATVLLNRRGLSKYLSGAITKEQFADDLAKEWASLPMDSGQSYYAGDSLNAALVSRSVVLNAIEQLK